MRCKKYARRNAIVRVPSVNEIGWRCQYKPFNDKTPTIASLHRLRKPLRDEYKNAQKKTTFLIRIVVFFAWDRPKRINPSCDGCADA